MGTRHTEPLMSLCQSAKYLCSFLDFKAVLLEIAKFLMISRNGWSIDDKTTVLLFTRLGDFLNILIIMDEHAFFLQLKCQVGGSLVIARYNESFF